MISAGIDVGSRAIKVVLWDVERGRVVASGMVDQGVRQEELVADLMDRTLAQAQLAPSDLAATVATGYGRHQVRSADTTITEITCHAHGVHHLAPASRTIIEIGGQDSKIIRLDHQGRVRDFNMNDRCAAGTGRFLELVAGRLGVGLPELGELSRASRKPAAISNTCVVFAETEIVGLLAGGAAPADIAAGVERALATRVAAMAGRALEPVVCFTGGVALLPGMVRALEEQLGCTLAVPPDPLFTGALGAALLASRRPGDSAPTG